jgi:cytochrome P450
MMPGVSHRSARTARTEDLHYVSADGSSDFVIPRGTPIGMTSMINHWNTDLFPNPDEFRPERWITADGERDMALVKKLLSFGKGTRSCIGENLAFCELYVMAAEMATKVLPRAKLVDTTREDIDYHHDLIVLQTAKGCISVKIAIE